MVYRFLEKDEKPKPTIAMDYSFGRKTVRSLVSRCVETDLLVERMFTERNSFSWKILRDLTEREHYTREFNEISLFVQRDYLTVIAMFMMILNETS